MKEIWKDVPWSKGRYAVSNKGNVKNLETRQLLNTTPRKENSYVQMSLYITGEGKVRVMLHRLVLEVFIGPCPEGKEANHGRNGKTDNSLSNLKWDTHSANVLDAYDWGGKLPNKTMLGRTGAASPRFGKKHSDKTKQTIKEKMSGENSVWFGRKHTEETKQKISAAVVGENNGQWGKKRTEEFKQQQSYNLRGEGNGSSKLTESQVLDIRKRGGKETQKSLALEFGVTQAQISSILLRKSWKFL